MTYTLATRTSPTVASIQRASSGAAESGRPVTTSVMPGPSARARIATPAQRPSPNGALT